MTSEGSQTITQHETIGRPWPATAAHADDRGWELDESHPHYEEPLHIDNGGLMLFVQYQEPTTGGRPIYERRFNITTRKRIEENNVEG